MSRAACRRWRTREGLVELQDTGGGEEAAARRKPTLWKKEAGGRGGENEGGASVRSEIAMENLQQLPQLEALCERLYNAQDHGERTHAESVLLVFSSSSEYAPQCKAILDNSTSPYAQLVSGSSNSFRSVGRSRLVSLS